MKILHVGKYYFPKRGGIETANKMIAEFSATTKENDVVVINNSKTGGVRFLNNVKVYDFKSYTFFSQPFSVQYFLWYFKNYKKFDIIHFHIPNYFALLLLFLSLKKSTIIHWHADIEKINFLISFPLRILEYVCLKKASYIIVGTKRYAKSSKSLKPFNEKIRIIPYGIQLKNIKKPKKYNNIISVGRLVNYKGIIPLLKRIKKIDNWKWIIVGDGVLMSDIKKIIDKKKLNDFVELRPNLCDAELIDLYRKSKIFLFPSISRQESFGIVQLEAMSNFCSVINFNIPGSGVSEITKNNFTGYSLDLFDYDTMLKKLYELTKNSKLLNSLQNNSNIHVSDSYGSINFCHSITELYKEFK